MTGNLIKFGLPLLIGAAVGAAIVGLSDAGKRGVPDLWGDNPKADNTKPNDKFDPDYMAVLYLKFGDGASSPRLLARHAYFPVSKDPAADKVDCAIQYLAAHGAPTPPSDNCGLNGAVREGLVGFDFGRQMRIYAFVDNADVAFNGANPLSFTPFGPFGDPAGKPDRAKNHSFYNAKVEALSVAGNRTVLHFKNFWNDGDGKKPTKDKNAIHSINFNLVFCKKAGQPCAFDNPKEVIPMVIDPDGGNMGGGSPPPG